MKNRIAAALILLPALALQGAAANAREFQSMPPMTPNDQTAPAPSMPGPPPKRPMMSAEAMNCPGMHEHMMQMMTEIQGLRQDIAELRAELRRDRR
jgi:hypothetical protein